MRLIQLSTIRFNSRRNVFPRASATPRLASLVPSSFISPLQETPTFGVPSPLSTPPVGRVMESMSYFCGSTSVALIQPLVPKTPIGTSEAASQFCSDPRFPFEVEFLDDHEIFSHKVARHFQCPLEAGEDVDALRGLTRNVRGVALFQNAPIAKFNSVGGAMVRYEYEVSDLKLRWLRKSMKLATSKARLKLPD